MAVAWKTKQTQRNLLGKSTLTHQANMLSPSLQYIGEEVVLDPPAFNYDNIIGTIWNQEQGAYDKAPTGQIYVSDPSPAVTPQWGGSYDNR